MLLLKNLEAIEVLGIIHGRTIICDGSNGAISCNRSCFANGASSALAQKVAWVYRDGGDEMLGITVFKFI
tara:strand:- start:171 stop:380 length:210 start_codon:yes stop_codon:yes gene_type:complete